MIKKIQPFFLILFLLASCTFVPIPTSSVSTVTEAVVPIASSIPVSTASPSSPCSEDDLVTMSESIKTIFKKSRLEEIQLKGDPQLQGGNFEFSPDGSRIAISIYVNSNYLWSGIYILSLANGQLLCFIPDKNNNTLITDFSFNSDGSILATIYNDGSILVRNSNTGAIISELKNANSQPSYGRISFNYDTSLAVTSGYFQPVRVWNTHTGQLVFENKSDNVEREATHAAFSPDGNFVAVVSDSGGIKIFNLSSNKVEITIEDSNGERYILFSKDGNFIYSLDNNSEVSIWDSHTGKKVQTLNPFTEQCTGYCGWEVETRISLSTDSSLLLMENPTKIILWDTQTWQELLNGRNNDIHEFAPIVDASVNPNGTMIGINYSYTTIRFWYLNP